MEYLNKLLNLNPFSYNYKQRNNIFFKAVIENFDHDLKKILMSNLYKICHFFLIQYLNTTI
mgnify:CR=1 FL=1